MKNLIKVIQNEKQLNLVLPKRKIRKLKYKDGTDSYGALDVASKFLNIKKPRKKFKNFWQHGCQPPWWDECSFHSYGVKKHEVENFFVARKDQEVLLKKEGYQNVYSIGLPFNYVETNIPIRIKNSLLVMPHHSLESVKLENEDKTTDYVNYINRFRDFFDLIVVCLHRGDIENGYWIYEFEKIGIKSIIGGDANDMNSLQRMKKIFLSFEFMTTPFWGSQIGYALYSGNKVSICGPKLKLNKKDLLLQNGGIFNEQMFSNINSSETNEKMKKFLENFYTEPHKGKAGIKLGAFLIGYDNILSKSELMKLFNWNKSYNLVKIYSKFELKSIYDDLEMFIKGLIPIKLKYILKKFFNKLPCINL